MGYNKPPLLGHGKPFWFMAHIFHNITRKNKHWAAVVGGESGSGKSWLSISLCEATYPEKFNIRESVAFTPIQFLELVSKKHPKMFPIILDDAGLSAFSGDALTAQVKNISKVAQSVRHKNWQIIFNLPSLDLLAKSVRITNHYYLEPVWIDYQKRITYTKFQRLKASKFSSGGLKRMNLTTKRQIKNPNTGYNHSVISKHISLPVPAPSKENIKIYEKLKEEFLDKFRRETAEELRIQKEKQLGKSLDMVSNAAEEMRPSIDVYTTEKGAPDVAMIKRDFDNLGIISCRLAWKMAMLPKKKDVEKAAKLMEKKQQKYKRKWSTTPAQ